MLAERWGSSPLTRGKLRCLVIPPGPVGLIPAHAGKTTSNSLSPSSRKAHPRSRGENLTPAGAVNEIVGSSPLTRGKREFRY